ncbi:polysaccharide biosynthesis/export family protein [Urechidicola croceus]|uniref:Uncharacterized protein n=1 Tax=Urechidicola croceus TaxID=1850246 RepID=A0A1D8P687_9FLAO|nr:polysaccharide biosynthesis/export family protein [Urechidicola croceus]AOW20088.1 hypothetical protein LPB138_05065 [Urechidicola croceus]
MKKVLKNKFNFCIVILSVVTLLSSCGTQEDIVYFQNIKNNQNSSRATSYTPTLNPDDLIKIHVLAFDMQAVGPFNGQGITGSVSGEGSKSYLIDQNGNIEFPVLGNIKLAGLTRLEATELLKKKIAEYVKEPIVNISIENFKITVLGEVKNPGTFRIDNERITILEALGLAGDLTIYGERKDILVVRESDGKRINTRVDLTTDEVFQSPVFYLAQNDVIYIKPSESKIKQSKPPSDFKTIILPVIGVLLSAATLITR